MHTSACPVPTYPRWIGSSGALPFVLLTILIWLPGEHRTLAAQALLAYGAVILSFVGALHWGLAMSLQPAQHSPTGRMYAWSVVPALLAWVALLLPAAWAVAILLAGLWGQYAQDRRLARIVILPDWYLPLRLVLTSAASLALVLASPRLI
ncbi:MAG: DUF3429 domain-containing protein [Thiobacillaceae bacterium]